MTDRNEALRLADAARIAELEQALDRLQGDYLIAFERGRIAGIAELEKEALAKPFAPDWAGYRQGLEDGKREGQAERDQLRIDLDDELCNREVLDTMLTQCIAERDQLRAEVERLRADGERLDHIEKRARCDPKMDGQHVWWPTSFNQALKGPTLRAAIDAALTHKETP